MPSISILLVAIIFITLYFLWPRDYDPAKHGTWSNMIQAVGAIAFGLGSFVVAYSVYDLQRTQSADAALDRAATLIHQIYNESDQKRRLLETEPGTNGTRIYECVIYLKDRVIYTPQWTATAKQLSHPPYLLDPAELGKKPDSADFSPVPGKQWTQGQQKELDELNGQFNKCIGNDDDQSGNATAKSESKADIRQRGAKIRDQIGFALDPEELALMEWPTLPEGSHAKRLIEASVSADLCTSKRYQSDVFDLFVSLDGKVDDTDAYVRDFAKALIADYANVHKFLHDVCKPKFDSES